MFFFNTNYSPCEGQNGTQYRKNNEFEHLYLSHNLYIFEPFKRSQYNFITNLQVVTAFKFLAMSCGKNTLFFIETILSILKRNNCSRTSKY